MKSIELGKRELGLPDKEPFQRTDFIRLENGAIIGLQALRRVACGPNNYFGREPGVIDAIASYVKPGDKILISVPGLVKPLDDAMMEVFSKSWTAEQMDYIKPAEWWEELLGRSRAVTLDHIGPMKCYGQAWAGNHLPHGNPVSDLSPVVQVADRVQRDIAHPALVPVGFSGMPGLPTRGTLTMRPACSSHRMVDPFDQLGVTPVSRRAEEFGEAQRE